MDEYFAGSLAKKAGINVETIHYYERMKLLPKPKGDQIHDLDFMTRMIKEITLYKAC